MRGVSTEVSATIRPYMRSLDEPQLLDIARRAHPWRDLRSALHPWRELRSALFYEAYPTFVMEEDSRLVGYTAWTLTPDGRVMHGMDLAVDPDVQGRGYGTRLMRERFQIALGMQVVQFIGACAADNAAMIALFERFGLTREVTVTEDPVREWLVWSGRILEVAR
jgi:ribosomal-protein-alanine N-acetyltransferase